MPESTEPRRTRAALGATIGLAGSLLVHGFVFSGLHWAGTMPAVDFELTVPAEVEFGVTHAEPAPEPAASAAPPAPPAEPAPATAAIADPVKKPRKRRPEPVDAGSPEEPDEARGEREDRRPAEGAGRGERPLLSAFAPEGAQIALRLDLGRVRSSELAPDVRGLLDAVADFRLLLDGSGLDPLADLERLYIASPDLRRANLVIAGQYVGGEDVAERAVANLAAARGLPAEFRRHGAMRVAPWHDLDPTERVLALIAPHQFAITRSDDLDRVLQVARALAQRNAKSRRGSDLGAALLALEPDETLALSVEGVRLFARGNLRGVPERLEASVRTRRDGSLDVRVTGHFESAEAAELAQAYWERTRTRFADHPLVAFIGLRAPLAEAKLDAVEAQLSASTTVTTEQARVVLGFIRNALGTEPSQGSPAPRAAERGPAAPGPAPDRPLERDPLERPAGTQIPARPEPGEQPLSPPDP